MMHACTRLQMHACGCEHTDIEHQDLALGKLLHLTLLLALRCLDAKQPSQKVVAHFQLGVHLSVEAGSLRTWDLIIWHLGSCELVCVLCVEASGCGPNELGLGIRGPGGFMTRGLEAGRP